MKTNPVLYIIMRNDLMSLNAGKAIAQGAHAANQFVKEKEANKNTSTLNGLYTSWCASTNDGFGTTIVLGASIDDIHNIVYHAGHVKFCQSAIVHDPTYPLVDGETTHLLPLDTCAYLFFDKDNNEEALALLDRFELYP